MERLGVKRTYLNYLCAWAKVTPKKAIIKGRSNNLYTPEMVAKVEQRVRRSLSRRAGKVA